MISAVCKGTSQAAVFLCVGVGIVGCGDSNTPSPVNVPGAAMSLKTRVLEGGSAVLQGKAPVADLNIYLDGFHFRSGDMKAQMEAHHFCSSLSEEVFQCVIYDGNGRDAKLTGVEYVIGARLFEGLPAEEKKLWHSHVHEVKSGQLIGPGLPEFAERRLMWRLVGTYGKTWHTWHTSEGDTLPLGVPTLMMGFTGDGQVDGALVSQRDHRFGVSSDAKRSARSAIPEPGVLPGADSWKDGEALEFVLSNRY